MSNVAHSTMSGSNLHENKGAASASDDTVATVTSGATVWKKLTASNLTGTANSFGGQLLQVRNEQTSGTAGDSLSASTWNTHTLNTTKTNEISSASLASNQITLPAGTYFLDATATGTAGANGIRRLKLYNVTDASDTVLGLNCCSPTASGGNAWVKGRFTIAGTKVFEIRHYPTTTATQAASSVGTEVYVDVLIWKVA